MDSHKYEPGSEIPKLWVLGSFFCSADFTRVFSNTAPPATKLIITKKVSCLLVSGLIPNLKTDGARGGGSVQEEVDTIRNRNSPTSYQFPPVFNVFFIQFLGTSHFINHHYTLDSDGPLIPNISFAED